MKNKISCFALSILAFTVSHDALANTSTSPPAYPTYTSATGIPASTQVSMAARWLDLMMVNNIMPKSYDVSGYWPYMVANNPDYQLFRQSSDTGTCDVRSDHSNDATVERAIQQQGLDIYDGAVWQIALSIAAKNNPIQPNPYQEDIQHYTDFLHNGLSSGFNSYYAFNANNPYSYNGKLISSKKNSYLLKFISPSYSSNYDSINDCEMNWPEFSAVTGEEAWAVLIGPIQSAYLIRDGAHNSNWSSQASDYIQLGTNALGAIQQMQSASGGVYRNVTPFGQAQSYDISLENNFSLYAGLSLLEQALKADETQHRAQIKLANKKIADHIKHVQAINSDEDSIKIINNIKKGMVRFFTGQGGVTVFNSAGNYFYATVNDKIPATPAFAVDVQTWGATVIASVQKDPNDPNDPDLLQAMTDAYGKNVMYNMFEAAISNAAYYDDQNNLLGVGYTTQKTTDSFYELSGEWTFGAINAAIVLADYYKNDSMQSALLIKQAKNMLAGVTAEASNLQGSSASPTSLLSYLYANKRTYIPFGWFSNKAPATASTGWSVMVNSCFNPFELGGGNHQAICQQLS